MSGIATESLRDELQNLREQTERLERALVGEQRMATVGQLALRMAHEFNNILMLMMGRAEHALKYGDADVQTRALEKVVEAGRRAADIVANLRGYGADEAAKSEVVPADVLMESAASLVAWDLPKSGVELVKRYDSTARVRVVAGRLEQVLLNLILNARKAMDGGGTLTVTVGPNVQEGYVAFRIADTGCGIPPEDLERIFDPFFSTGPTERCACGGTGLGLSVARDLVRQAGGEIRVESAVGIGSTFTVLLPIAEDET